MLKDFELKQLEKETRELLKEIKGALNEESLLERTYRNENVSFKLSYFISLTSKIKERERQREKILEEE